MTYTYCKKIISNGKYNKDEMTDKLDIFLLNDRITEQEYNELIAMMNQDLS